MFGKLWQWMRFKRNNERVDIYRLDERMIYRYFDGQKEVAADPQVIYKRMANIGPELSVNIKVANSQHKDAGKAHNNLVAQIRGVFQVKPLDEGGLTELETAQLLDHFMIYIDELKKKSNLCATSLSNSAATGPSSEESPATSNSSGSGSTASAFSTAEPMPSLSDAASLSEPLNREPISARP